MSNNKDKDEQQLKEHPQRGNKDKVHSYEDTESDEVEENEIFADSQYTKNPKRLTSRYR